MKACNWRGCPEDAENPWAAPTFCDEHWRHVLAYGDSLPEAQFKALGSDEVT